MLPVSLNLFSNLPTVVCETFISEYVELNVSATR